MTLANRLIIRSLLALAIVFTFNSCNEDNLNMVPDFKIILHRGYHYTFLENTMESFRAAFPKGYEKLELDICFTKDFQPVVLHDYLLDNHSDSKGTIDEYTLDEVQNINLSGGYKIPRFESVLSELKNTMSMIFVDLKQPCPDSGLINIAKLIKQYDAYKIAFITCSNSDIIRKLHNIDTLLNVSVDGNDGFEGNLYECIQQKYKFTLVEISQLEHHLCFIAHEYGIKVYAYTPNTLQEMRDCLEYDIDGLMTDYPDLFRQVIK